MNDTETKATPATKAADEKKAAPKTVDHPVAVRAAADALATAIAAARAAGYHVDFRDAALTRIAVSETRRVKR